MEYRAPWLLKNGHAQSIFPSLFRKLADDFFQRERIATADGDFLDLDWSRVGSRRLVILSHGLEGHSRRPYVLGMARAANLNGWDALGWNFRSCGGEMNRNLRFYHSGATEDLDEVVRHVVAQNHYQDIALIGFSMGGNLSLVYLGQQGRDLHPAITRAVTFSVPCDLAASARQLAKPGNFIYMRRFMRDLRQKMADKQALFPDQIDLKGIEQMRTFQEFDDRYTAPLHGFRDADDYWTRCSSKAFLSDIQVPTLIVNAQNDPFLAEDCYPRRQLLGQAQVRLEIPRSGGHVGFVSFNDAKLYWSEARAMRFLNGQESL